MSVLSEKDRKALEEIQTLPVSTVSTGRDESGATYLSHVFRLHKTLFGVTCSHCPHAIPGYILKLKNYNSQSMKSEKKTGKTAEATGKEFRLSDGVSIPVPGTSINYTVHNLTDEKAIEILAVNPNRKALFAKMPKNVDELIAAHIKGKDTKGKTENGAGAGKTEVTEKSLTEALALANEKLANTEDALSKATSKNKTNRTKARDTAKTNVGKAEKALADFKAAAAKNPGANAGGEPDPNAKAGGDPDPNAADGAGAGKTE